MASFRKRNGKWQARIQRKYSPSKKAETKKRNERIRLEKKATHKKNIELGVYKGENSGPSKISDNDRKEICLRRYEGESYKQISNDYPLGLTGIKAVCDTWGPRNGFPFKTIVAKRSSKVTLI